MPSIIIDGKVCSFEGQKTILQVAIEHGLEIPHYCYHPGLSIVASCRLCLAEIEQPNPRTGKLERLPKLMPTCQTPAADGMVVHTRSPRAVANQKAVMEYLLINHPLDCPVCDQAGECYLQDYSFRYGRATSRFQEEKIKQPVKDLGPYVKLYADRCIMCTRCVRFCREITGTGELGVFGRGAREEIDLFPGRALDNELSGNVVDICPVGAMLDKDFLFAQRVWFLQETPSIDGLTAGGDNIWIHHNDGRIYRIKPRPNPSLNRWWISDEIRYGWKFVHSPERLSGPRRMQFGNAIECDWASAYSYALDNLQRIVREKGPGSLALLVSPMLACEEAYLLGWLVRRLDTQAILAVGPIPRQGQDKTFPGGYTIYAEKCPNSRGVRRALTIAAAQIGSSDRPVLSFEEFCQTLSDKTTRIAAAIITGNYPSPWVTPELSAALARKFLILLDTLPSELSAKADVLLPSVTWTEKSGTFENIRGMIQAFEQAIPPLPGARSEGQIALDLTALLEESSAAPYDAAEIRRQMGSPFTDQVLYPPAPAPAELDMVYVEL